MMSAATAAMHGAGAGAGAGAGSGAPAGGTPARERSAVPSGALSGGHTPGSVMPSMFFDEHEDVEREDGRKYNPQVMSFIRDDWIAGQMHEREGDFTEFHDLLLYCGTWNVNGKAPDEDVAAWLRAGAAGSRDRTPDIFAIGFQEIVDLNAANVVVGAATEKRAAAWDVRLARTLGEDYHQLMSKSLVGIQLVVFVRRSLLSHVTDVQGDTAGVGVLGVMGNKGGAAIRFKYDDSTLCFVCSHLAAKRSHVAQRGADFASIVNKITFVDAARAESARVSEVAGDTGSFGLLAHDFVFWLGDLNYRIVEGISIDEVNSRVDAGDLDFLRDRDQLNVERAAGRVFQQFEEGVINFLPTYKYQAGTDRYERRPDKKHRAPAWCDRILWRCSTSSPTHVRQLSYGRTEEKMSDHKPVYATFDTSVKTVVAAKRETVLREIMRRLDKMENESIPRVKLSTTVVHFPHVVFQQRSEQVLKITNTGEVAASWRLVPKLEEKYVSKGWLRIEPLFGMLPPGESAELRILCYIEEEVARSVAHARDILQDILILRLENGADFFVTVTGDYQPSCFCLTVGELVESVKPMRTCPIAAERVRVGPQSAAAHRAATSTDAAPLRVPKELWQLVDFVFKHGMDTPAVCVAPGVPEEMARVREALDVGDAIDGEISVVSVGATLVQLLRSLDDSVVPSALFPHAEFASVPVATWCKNMLQQLDTPSYNTFAYVVSFVRELLSHAAANDLTVDIAAQVFGNAMMRPPMSDDVDAVAAAAATMTTSTPLRAAGTTPAISSGLASRLITEAQQESVMAVMRHFLTSPMAGGST